MNPSFLYIFTSWRRWSLQILRSLMCLNAGGLHAVHHHKCLQTYQCLFVSINILFVGHMLLLPTPAPQHDDQRMLNLATNTRGEWKRWWIEMLCDAFSYWKFEIRGEISSGSSSYLYYMFGIPFSGLRTPLALERRGSRLKSSSIIAPNPRSGERSGWWKSPVQLGSWWITHVSLLEPLIMLMFDLKVVFFEDGCFLFRIFKCTLETSFRRRIGERMVTNNDTWKTFNLD